MTQQPIIVGLAEAARVAGVSESTIRRRRVELQALGAVQGSKGWKIPIPALIELGLMARTTAPDEVVPPETSQVTPVEDVMTGDTASELEALRKALAAAEQRAAVAEAIALERERIIEVQGQALRMLEAPREPVSTSTVIPPEGDVTPSDKEAPTPPDRENKPVHKKRDEQAQPGQVSAPSEQGVSSPPEHPVPAPRRRWWQWGPG